MNDTPYKKIINDWVKKMKHLRMRLPSNEKTIWKVRIENLLGLVGTLKENICVLGNDRALLMYSKNNLGYVCASYSPKYTKLNMFNATEIFLKKYASG
jgi:hypothetical protein